MRVTLRITTAFHLDTPTKDLTLWGSLVVRIATFLKTRYNVLASRRMFKSVPLESVNRVTKGFI